MKVFRLSSRIVLLVSVVIASFLAAFIGQIVVTNFTQGPSLVSNQGLIIRQSDNPFVNFADSESAIQAQRESMVDIYSAPFTQFGVVSQGIIVTSDGWIVTTNSSDIAEERMTHVRLENGDVYDVLRTVDDPTTGLRFLSIEATNLRPVILSETINLSIFEPYMVLSSSGKTKLRFLEGEVISTGLYHSSDRLSRGMYLQDVSHADMVLDEKTEMIGIVMTQDDGFMLIDSSFISSRLRELLREDILTLPAMGVNYIDLAHNAIDDRIADGIKRGAYLSNAYVDGDTFISSISSTTPAYKGGLRSGDIITHVDGEELTKEFSLSDALIRRDEGETVEVEALRAGLPFTTDITLE